MPSFRRRQNHGHWVATRGGDVVDFTVERGTSPKDSNSQHAGELTKDRSLRASLFLGCFAGISLNESVPYCLRCFFVKTIRMIVHVFQEDERPF